MKVAFVDSQRVEHGVQPVLAALEGTPAQIAPSTYYAAKTRSASARACRVPRQGDGAGLGRCRTAGSVVWSLARWR
jgi:hypothetical protein